MIEILASIDAPDTPRRKGFVAGIVLWDDVVIEAAPIVQRMAKEHWHRNRVRSYCAERGWSVSVVWRQEREHPHEFERRRPR